MKFLISFRNPVVINYTVKHHPKLTKIQYYIKTFQKIRKSSILSNLYNIFSFPFFYIFFRFHVLYEQQNEYSSGNILNSKSNEIIKNKVIWWIYLYFTDKYIYRERIKIIIMNFFQIKKKIKIEQHLCYPLKKVRNKLNFSSVEQNIGKDNEKRKMVTHWITKPRKGLYISRSISLKTFWFRLSSLWP